MGRPLPRYLRRELPCEQLVAQAGSISCQPLPDGGYRLSLRGVGTIENVLPPMNVPFLIVVV